MNADWVKEFPGAVTVCDVKGIILYMNDKAFATFAAGDRSLIGANILDCHPGPARQKLAALLAEGRANTYTIEKNGVKKLVHQAPWYRGGEYAGLVELSVEIPFELPHFIRTPPPPK